MKLFELLSYYCALIKLIIEVNNFNKVSVPLPLLSQSHFRHALLGAGVGHSTPAYKGLLVTVSIIMSIVTNDVTCSLSITQSFLISAGRFLCAKILSPSRRTVEQKWY